jgi:hypothetical protein
VKLRATLLGDPVMLSGRLPTGELVVCTRSALRHIQTERSRTITREQLVRCLKDPIRILKDERDQHSARSKIYAFRRTANPLGLKGHRMQRLIVHMKPCKLVLGIFSVHWVTTALKSSKLPPKGIVVWERHGESQ